MINPPARWLALGATLLFAALLPGVALAQAAAEGAVNVPVLSINIAGGEGAQVEEVSSAMKIIGLMTILSLAPGIIVTLTSFTRIVIVFSFMRQALGTNQAPPNQVLVGLALFMTWFIMTPTINEINEVAYQPYTQHEISAEDALYAAAEPMRDYMLNYTREKDLALFLEASKEPKPQTINDIPFKALVPAFMISELKTAFQIGFLIYLPFLIIDMVVASVLLAMGMMVLPPVMISLPFKLMLFVLVDGWNLLVRSLLGTFH